jgi:hypothetical protein
VVIVGGLKLPAVIFRGLVVVLARRIRFTAGESPRFLISEVVILLFLR